jgi:hypothetical protein
MIKESKKFKSDIIRSDYKNLQLVLDLTRKKIEIKGVSY